MSELDRRSGSDRRKEEPRKFLATMRVTFDADDEVEARIIGNELAEALAKHVLEDDDTADVTQIIPMFLPDAVTPEEVVGQLRRCIDMLIKTRISQCVDLAQWMHRVAWLLETRSENDYSLANYDYGEFMKHMTNLLQENK